MGYTTDFYGWCNTSNMTDKIKEYLNRFSSIRHMKRSRNKLREIYPDWQSLCFNGVLGYEGQFFAPKSSNFGQEQEESILDYNKPPEGCPGLWCDWEVNDKNQIVWNNSEKFYNYTDWLTYIIKNFLAPEGVICDGAYLAVGESPSDAKYIIVSRNEVQYFNAMLDETANIIEDIYGRNEDVIKVFNEIKKSPEEIIAVFWDWVEED